MCVCVCECGERKTKKKLFEAPQRSAIRTSSTTLGGGWGEVHSRYHEKSIKGSERLLSASSLLFAIHQSKSKWSLRWVQLWYLCVSCCAKDAKTKRKKVKNQKWISRWIRLLDLRRPFIVWSFCSWTWKNVHFSSQWINCDAYHLILSVVRRSGVYHVESRKKNNSNRFTYSTTPSHQHVRRQNVPDDRFRFSSFSSFASVFSRLSV